MNREIGVFAVLYDVIGDSAVIVRFEEIDESVGAGKLYLGDAPGRRSSTGRVCRLEM